MSAALFVLSRLARDRSALVGLLLIALLGGVALLAPVLATHPGDILEWRNSARHGARASP